MWRCMPSRRYENPEKDEIYQALKTEVEGKSPQEGYLAYYVANRTNGKDERKAALEEVAKKYAGQAVAFWPRQELLRIKFNALNEAKAGSAAYQALYADCLTYEKERKAQKGDNAKIVAGCTAVKNLTETLTGKGVGVRMEDKNVCVTFRNLDKATLTLREGDKMVKTWNLTNPTRSFYVYDTVRVALPALGDGTRTGRGRGVRRRRRGRRHRRRYRPRSPRPYPGSRSSVRLRGPWRRRGRCRPPPAPG